MKRKSRQEKKIDFPKFLLFFSQFLFPPFYNLLINFNRRCFFKLKNIVIQYLNNLFNPHCAIFNNKTPSLYYREYMENSRNGSKQLNVTRFIFNEIHVSNDRSKIDRVTNARRRNKSKKETGCNDREGLFETRIYT